MRLRTRSTARTGAVTQEANDKKQLVPMITIIEEQSGGTPTQLLADAGYCSDENLAAIADTPIDAYISTRKRGRPTRRSDASVAQEDTPRSLNAAMASPTDMVGAQHEAM